MLLIVSLPSDKSGAELSHLLDARFEVLLANAVGAARAVA
jgi:hypothetical protein